MIRETATRLAAYVSETHNETQLNNTETPTFHHLLGFV